MRSFLSSPHLLLAAVLPVIGGCRGGGNSSTASTPPISPSATVVTEPIKAVPDKDRYKVTAETTGLFKYSPLQAAGSDVDLKKGTHLIVLKHGRGFTQVRTPDNLTGFVGTEDIAPLSAAEMAQEDSSTLEQAAVAAGGAPPTPLEQATAAAGGSAGPTAPTKKTARVNASSSGVTIPSDAGRNEQLPEPESKPKGKPTPKPTPAPGVNIKI